MMLPPALSHLKKLLELQKSEFKRDADLLGHDKQEVQAYQITLLEELEVINSNRIFENELRRVLGDRLYAAAGVVPPSDVCFACGKKK